MIHYFKQGQPHHPVFLLLHGTGGNEYDLVPMAESLDEKATIISLRGNVIENGMPRFFRRLQEGVFDEKDLVYRTHQLIDTIDQFAKDYQFDKTQVIVIGYSNGANIASSVLFHRAEVFKAAMLMHPMIPLKNINLPDLSKVAILITSGTNDPIVTKSESQTLYRMFLKANAKISIQWFDFGHRISKEEVESIKQWYLKIIKEERLTN